MILMKKKSQGVVFRMVRTNTGIISGTATASMMMSETGPCIWCCESEVDGQGRRREMYRTHPSTERPDKLKNIEVVRRKTAQCGLCYEGNYTPGCYEGHAGLDPVCCNPAPRVLKVPHRAHHHPVDITGLILTVLDVAALLMNQPASWVSCH